MSSTETADALRDAGLLDSAALERAERLAAERGIALDRAAVALGLLTEDQVLFVLAERHGVEFVFPTAGAVDRELVAKFPVDLLRRADALPLLSEAGGAVVAFAELPDAGVVDEFAKWAGGPVRPVLASRRRLHHALDQVVGDGHDDPARVSAQDFSGMTAFYRHLVAVFGGGAEELRFEPTGSEIRVRRRRRGAVVDCATEPAAVAAGVVARARMLAGLPTPDAATPQSAAFTTRIAGRDVRLALTVLPTSAGEAVVLRRVWDGETPASLDGFGAPTAVVELLRGPFAAPAGDPGMAGGLVVVAATERAAAHAFVAAWLRHVDPANAVAVVSDDAALGGPRAAHGALAAVRATRPDVLVVDGGGTGDGAAESLLAADAGARVVLTLAAARPRELLEDVVGSLAPRTRAARALTALVVLERRPVDCAACRGAGCEACGRTGFDGVRIAATGAIVDAAARARVASGAPVLAEGGRP